MLLKEYYTSPIIPTIIFLLFTLFLSHELLIKFSPLYITHVRGAYDKFPDFFRMDTFIDSTHMKL